MSTSHYTQQPPSYQGIASNEAPGESSHGVASGPERDDIPDDFKYGVTVEQSDISVRHTFVRKVYTILFIQLLTTTVVGGYLRYIDATNGFLIKYTWSIYVAMFGTLAFFIGLIIKKNSHPANLVFLSLFTLSEGYVVGAATAFYSTPLVLQALLITLGIFAVLTLVTFQSRYDFSKLGPILFYSLCAILIVGLVRIFVPFGTTADLIIAILTALVFCGYVLYDTHMIMRRLSPDEYIIGSVELYLDVINLFLAILRILGDRD